MSARRPQAKVPLTGPPTKLPLLRRLEDWLWETWNVAVDTPGGLWREIRGLLHRDPARYFHVVGKRGRLLPGVYAFLLASILLSLLLPVLAAIRRLDINDFALLVKEMGHIAAPFDVGSPTQLLATIAAAIVANGTFAIAGGVVLYAMRLVQSASAGFRLATSALLLSLVSLALFVCIGKLSIGRHPHAGEAASPWLVAVMLSPLMAVSVPLGLAAFRMSRHTLASMPRKPGHGIARASHGAVALIAAAGAAAVPWAIGLCLVLLVNSPIIADARLRRSLNIAEPILPTRFCAVDLGEHGEAGKLGCGSSGRPQCSVGRGGGGRVLQCDLAGIAQGLPQLFVDAKYVVLRVAFEVVQVREKELPFLVVRLAQYPKVALYPDLGNAARTVQLDGSLNVRYPAPNGGTDAQITTNRVVRFGVELDRTATCGLQTALQEASARSADPKTDVEARIALEVVVRDPVPLPEMFAPPMALTEFFHEPPKLNEDRRRELSRQRRSIAHLGPWGISGRRLGELAREVCGSDE